MVVKNRLEAVVDPLFLPASYGYRPNKSALDAVGQARQMCWVYDWGCDLDIKGFLDNLDHDLMMKAVRKHAQERSMELYIERWLKAPAQDEEGNLLKRERGTPQGGVISPLLANLFLHYCAPGQTGCFPAGEIPAPTRGGAALPGIESWVRGGNESD